MHNFALYALTIFSIFYANIIWCNHPSGTIETASPEMPLITQAQLYRHYHIQRMTEYIHTIQQFHMHNPSALITIIKTIDITKHKGHHIQELHQEIIRQKKICLLYHFWQSFNSFPYPYTHYTPMYNRKKTLLGLYH